MPLARILVLLLVLAIFIAAAIFVVGLIPPPYQKWVIAVFVVVGAIVAINWLMGGGIGGIKAAGWIALVALLSTMACSKSDTAAAPPAATPIPPQPVATKGPPCKAIGPGADGIVYQGGCEVTDKCKDAGHGEFIGDCHAP